MGPTKLPACSWYGAVWEPTGPRWAPCCPMNFAIWIDNVIWQLLVVGQRQKYLIKQWHRWAHKRLLATINALFYFLLDMHDIEDEKQADMERTINKTIFESRRRVSLRSPRMRCVVTSQTAMWCIVMIIRPQSPCKDNNPQAPCKDKSWYHLNPQSSHMGNNWQFLGPTVTMQR